VLTRDDEETVDRTPGRSRLRIVILGLSITSSWGNGHATTYRSLVKGLAGRGHDVLFLERDVPWYGPHRDLPQPPYGRTALYADRDDLAARFSSDVRDADLVIVGSFVPEGSLVGAWVLGTARGARAFYDIDTPITLAMLEKGEESYLTRALVPRYDLYLSFTGGPTLERLTRDFGAARALPLYCSVDPERYAPSEDSPRYDLGYLGTHSEDRRFGLERLLLDPARRWPGGRFLVAGAQYPESIDWPVNVSRREHVPPYEHAAWYGAQRFTLNLTRSRMVEAGHSPSVRLFEAAACGVPVVSDWWRGLDEFFDPGDEIFVAKSASDVLGILRGTTEAKRREVAGAARARVLEEHTGDRRAAELERYVLEPASAR
jgi:spore maturation protein CgeB